MISIQQQETVAAPAGGPPLTSSAPGGTSPATPAYDQFTALLAQRHSCRGFRPQPLPRELVTRIVATAGRSASWCNAQPWHVHIVSGAALEGLRTDISARAHSGAAATPELDWPLGYEGVYRDRRRACGWSLYEAVGVGKGDRDASTRQAMENFHFFGAPHLALVTSPALLGTHGVMDCGAWVSNFLLAASSLGVGAIAQAAVASWPDILRQHLPIPDDRHIVCGISFGYEDPDHRANHFRTARADLDEIVTWVE
ncbi:nitroreductase [Acidovorax delafieldii]|nr:nitroreductase [Acidovorax delafieldii]